MSYPVPFYAFPFPEDLECGQPYIHWPAGKDLLVTSNFQTAVAIPESWVDVGVGEDEKTNRTKEAYSLVMPRKRTLRCDSTKFVPVYRNKTFETSEDKFTQPDKYYLEYLGPPSTHIRTQTCNLPYHLLSFRFAGSVMDGYKLARYESNDWLFQLYSGGTEKPYEMVAREPLAESRVINVCDKLGKHTRYEPGKPLRCDFEEYVEPEPTPCYGLKPTSTWEATLTPTSEPDTGGRGVNLGLAVGLPLGIVGALLLVGLGVYFAPWFRRRLRRERAIQL